MINTITREQIADRLDKQLPLILVEALPKQYFDAQHLPGAINIPHDEIAEKAAQLLPAKDSFVVVYCANTACRNSQLASRTLQQLGYSNVFEYVQGKQDWIEAELPVEKS